MNGVKNYKALSDTKKEVLFSELYSLLISGLDLTRAFRLLIDGEREKILRQLLEHIYVSVVNGKTLWESFAGSGYFSSLDCGVLQIGEETGQISECLSFLTDYYRKRTEQRRIITGAVSYPLIILGTAIVVLIFMLMVIVPMFEQVYVRMGGELPAITRAIIHFSKDFPLYLLIFVGLMAASGIFFFFYGKTDFSRALFAEVLLKFPVLGSLMKKNYQARFCKLLYLLYSSGVPLLKSVEMLKGIITFYPYQYSFERIATGLKQGKSLTGQLACFPSIYGCKLIALLQVGEETNRLENMLLKQGEELTRELEHQLKQLGHLMEPVLILGIGAIVAIILVAMYLPMFRLGNIMG